MTEPKSRGVTAMYETPCLNTDDKAAPYYVVRREDVSSVCGCLKRAGVKVTMMSDQERLATNCKGVQVIEIILIGENDVLAASEAMCEWIPSTPRGSTNVNELP